MSRTELRGQLNAYFPTDEALDGFCLDHFPAVQVQFAGGMSRTQKHNLLLQLISAEQLTATLCAIFCQPKRRRPTKTRTSKCRGEPKPGIRVAALNRLLPITGPPGRKQTRPKASNVTRTASLPSKRVVQSLMVILMDAIGCDEVTAAALVNLITARASRRNNGS